MMQLGNRLFFAGVLACLGQVVSAEVTCTFDTLSTINEKLNIADYAFRVRKKEGGLVLEQRDAAKNWFDQSTVQRFNRPGFVVFLHLPTGGYEIGRSQMLTIHQSGQASLAIHHGWMGNTTQIGRAWLYQGECSETP